MVSRLLGAGALLLVVLLSVPACDKKETAKKPTMTADPDKVEHPRPGGKAG